MLRYLTTTFMALAALYAGVCIILFIFQRSLIYFPHQQPALRTDENRMTMRVPGAELKLTVRPRDGPDALLYFGGNAEDVSLNLPMFTEAFPGRAIFLLHYRGYGGSSGKPSEEALYADAIAVFDQLYTEHPNVVVIGRSLGGAVALYLASRRPVERLVLVTPFDSILDLAQQQFPYIPVRWLLLDKYESRPHVPRMRAPTTFVVAEQDEIVPRESAERLYARFPAGVAVMEVIPGVGHNSLSQSPAYLPVLQGE